MFNLLFVIVQKPFVNKKNFDLKKKVYMNNIYMHSSGTVFQLNEAKAY